MTYITLYYVPEYFQKLDLRLRDNPGSTYQMNGVNKIIDVINCYKRKTREIAMALFYRFKLGM